MCENTGKFVIEWLEYRLEKGAHIAPKYIDMTNKYLWENAQTVQRSIASGRSLEEIMGALVKYNEAKDHKFIFSFPSNLGWNEVEQYFNATEPETPKTPEEIERIYLDWHREETRNSENSPLGNLEEKIIREIMRHESTYGELKEIAHYLRVTDIGQNSIELCFEGYGGSVVDRYLYDYQTRVGISRVGLISIVSNLLAIDRENINILNIDWLYMENRCVGESRIDFCSRIIDEKRSSLVHYASQPQFSERYA